MIQAALDKGDMRIDDATQVETHPFPLEQPINMVNLHPVSHHSGALRAKTVGNHARSVASWPIEYSLRSTGKSMRTDVLVLLRQRRR